MVDTESGLARSLILGEERRLSIFALFFGLLLFLLVASVDYTWISLCTQRTVALCPRYPHNIPPGDFEYSPTYWVLRWSSLAIGYGHSWLYDDLLIVGLAGIHAYFNLGYLPSLALPTATRLGSQMFFIGGSVNDYDLVFLPGEAIERFWVVELVLLASLGFTLGVLARDIARRVRSSQGSPL